MKSSNVSAVLLLLASCGGPPAGARTVLEQLGEGLNVADEGIAHQIEVRGPEAREQVIREVDAGTITTIEQGLARFEELMTPTNRARRVVRVARGLLLAVERALDEWKAGVNDAELTFYSAAACALTALSDVVSTIEEVGGIDLPDTFVDAVQALGGFAQSSCTHDAGEDDGGSDGQ